jgi:hypothetical protein
MGKKQELLIFDDQVAGKKQQKIEEYFLRGRKVAGGVSCVYLSQKIYGIPTLIRRQFNYVIILKLSGAKDMESIITNYSLSLDANKIVELYKKATKVKYDFLKIDVCTRDDNKIISHNFTGFFKISDGSDSDSDEK